MGMVKADARNGDVVGFAVDRKQDPAPGPVTVSCESTGHLYELVWSLRSLGFLLLMIIVGAALVPRHEWPSAAVPAKLFATSTVSVGEAQCTSGICVGTAGHHDVKIEIRSASSSSPLPVGQLREVGVRHLEPGQVATRKALMTQLRDWTTSDGTHRIAMVGQGGSGKSTLAQWLLGEVCRGLRPPTRLVFFLQAGDLMRGYRALLRELQGIVGRESADPDKDEDVRRLVHALLRDGRVRGVWVGVLDDLPPPADLPEHGLGWLLREDADGFPWGSGKTVVTSRSAEWANGYTLGGGGITVGNFEPDEAVAFLTGVGTHWSPDAEGVAD